MRKKLASIVNAGAGVILPLLALGTLAGCHKHPAEPPPRIPQQFNPYDQQAMLAQMAQEATNPGENWKTRIFAVFLGAIIGALVGAFFSKRAQPIRYWLAAATVVVLCVYGMFVNDGFALFGSAALSGMVTYVLLSLGQATGDQGFEPIFGNARPATREEIAAAGHALAYEQNTNTSTRDKPGIPLGKLV